MKALRYLGPGQAEVEEMPVPARGPGEALIAVRACGVCATDVKTFVRGHPKIRPGSVLGHEIAGVIEAVNGAEGWQVGQRVAVAPYAPCGACPQCVRGRLSLCERLFEVLLEPGGFSEYLRVPPRIVASGLLPLPENVAFVEASFAEPLACCLHGMEMLDVSPGEALLIIGDGPMGLLQAQLGRLFGASPILLSGMTPERLEWAAHVADVVIDARREDVAEAVRRATGGGADKVMVSVGEAGVAQSALALARKGGAINLFAGMPGDAQLTLDVNWIHYDEITILGSFGFGPEHFRRALELIAERKVEVASLVTTTVPLAGVKAALEAAAQHRGVKTVVVLEEGGPIE